MSFNPGTATSSATPLTVSINNIPSGATVYYTTDGSIPSAKSGQNYSGTLPNPDSPATKIYTAAFVLSGSCPVQAVAYNSAGNQITPIISAQYYVADSNMIGITDAWQNAHVTGGVGVLTPTTVNNLSPGGSGLTYLQDYLLGYDPNLFSTNGDGISDLLNYQSGYKGDNYNISGSTLTNAQLIAQGIDPFLPYSPPSPPTPGNGSGPVITVLLPTNAQPSP